MSPRSTVSKDEQKQTDSSHSNKQHNQDQSPQRGSFLTGLHRMFGNRSTGKMLQDKAKNAQEETQRKEALQQESDIKSPLIANDRFRNVRFSAGDKTQSYLNKDKEVLALRESLQRAARARIEDNIDNVDSASDEEKQDAKKYSDELIKRAAIVEQSLNQYSRKLVQDNLPADQIERLEKKARDGYGQVAPQPSISLEKQIAAAEKLAIRNVESESELLVNESLEKIKLQISDQIQKDATFLNSGVEVGQLGKEEVAQRHQLDDLLVEDSDIETIYTNKLFEPIKQAVVMKLGVGRGAWRRSKELNTFRDKMKKAAREQANSDIDTQVDTNNLTANKSALGKKFYGMLAKKNAYSMAKGSLNKVMEQQAEDIVLSAIPKSETQQKLKTAAKTSAYDVARVNQAETKKIREASLTGAKIKAIEVLKQKQTFAVNEARKITKGDKQDPSSTPDMVKQTSLEGQVKDQVTQDDIAGQSIKQAVEAPSLNSGLTKIGRILDAAVPHSGDSSSFEFELKIPIDKGFYVLFGLAGEASRDEPSEDEKELVLSTQITFGAGFTTFGLDANFRAGVYLESQGKDSTGVMNLISYGLYRGMRNVAPSAADHFWGQGGKSGMKEVEEAELWAAMIEQQDMVDGNYVDMGLITQLKAEINAGVAEMGGSLAYKRLKRYDQRTIEQLNSGGFGDATDLDKLKEKAAALGSGSTRNVVEAEAEVTVGIAGQDVSFGLSVSRESVHDTVTWEISASGSIPFEFGDDATKFAEYAVKLATPLVGSAKNLFGVIQNKKKLNPQPGSPSESQQQDKQFKAKTGGAVTDITSDMLMTAPVPELDNLSTKIAESIKGDETVNDTIRGWLTGDSSASPIETVNKVGLSRSLDLSIGLSNEWKAGVSEGWTISLEVGETKSFEVDAEIVKVAIEKSKRLGKLEYNLKDKKGSGELFGVSIG